MYLYIAFRQDFIFIDSSEESDVTKIEKTRDKNFIEYEEHRLMSVSDAMKKAKSIYESEKETMFQGDVEFFKALLPKLKLAVSLLESY